MFALGIDVHAMCDSSIQAGFELPRSRDKVQSDLVLLSVQPWSSDCLLY